MFRALVIALLASSCAVFASSTSTISISNISGMELQLWLNGDLYTLAPGGSVSYPCFPDEQHSLQTENTSRLVSCGAFLRL